jgi:AcrR family transcriptional regulator
MQSEIQPHSRSVDRQPTPVQDLPDLPGENPTRVRILLGGLELFAERGYHATSIRDIAAGAGIQSASLYAHFASKESLLAELVMLAHDVHHRALVSALMDAGPDPVDQLRALIRTHVVMHCRLPKLATVANHERHHLSPEALAPAATLRRASEQLGEEVLARGVVRGQFQLVNDEIAVLAVSSMGVAVSGWYPQRGAGLSPEEVGDVYATLALRMVGVTEA